MRIFNVDGEMMVEEEINTVEFVIRLQKALKSENIHYEGSTIFGADIHRKELERLEKKIETYEKCIKLAMENTYDDDTHEFLDRVLKGELESGLSYRLNVSDRIKG